MAKKLLALFLVLIMVSVSLMSCAQETPASQATADETSQATGDATEAASGDTIKLGVIQPRSGSLAVSGEDSYWGNQIAIDMFNDRGGVDGVMVEAVVADVPDQNAAQTEVTRLIQQEGVTAITGVYGSSLASVAASICDRNDVLYWESISVTDELTNQGYETVFRMHINGTGFGYNSAEVAAAFIDELGVSDVSELTVAIVTDNNDGAISMNNGAAQYCEENGINVVLNEVYDSKNPDTSPVALKLKDADPDVAIVMSYINDGIDLTKQTKNLNWSPDLWLGLGSGYGIAAYEEALGFDAQGIIDIDPTAAPNLDKLAPEMAELVADFEARYIEARGYNPPAIGYLCWQATWVLLNDVIAPAGGTDDVDALIANAKALDIPEGTLPTGAGVKFDENGQNERAVLAAMQWQDGELVTLYPEFVANAEPIWIPLPAWDERAE